MYKIVYLFDSESELYASRRTTYAFDRESAFILCDILYKSSNVFSVTLYDEYLHIIKIWGD